MTLESGTTIGGRYQIIQPLGSGGFGQTYLAEDRQQPGKPRCVVKQLKPRIDTPLVLQDAQQPVGWVEPAKPNTTQGDLLGFQNAGCHIIDGCRILFDG